MILFGSADSVEAKFDCTVELHGFCDTLDTSVPLYPRTIPSKKEVIDYTHKIRILFGLALSVEARFNITVQSHKF